MVIQLNFVRPILGVAAELIPAMMVTPLSHHALMALTTEVGSSELDFVAADQNTGSFFFFFLLLFFPFLRSHDVCSSRVL